MLTLITYVTELYHSIVRIVTDKIYLANTEITQECKHNIDT